MIGIKKTKQTLDEKVCFDAWITTGSVYKARFLLKNEDGTIKTNERTGKPYTHQGIWESAWRYVLTHMADARKEVEQVWRSNGQLLTDADWYPMIVRKAKYLYTPKKFEKYIQEHSYLTPYLNG